ncbi:hypothetical protein BDY24DRAFT_186569 [Mrakia frigida]|uniref:uncharacterized protein n=1 Tax=Mrakia frigida TaxID=29902 RepID=UPI003FCC23A5
MTRILSSLLLLAAVLPSAVLAKNESASDIEARPFGISFGSYCNPLTSWKTPSGACVDFADSRDADSLPTGKSCPVSWYYSSEVTSCVPSSYLASLFSFWTCPGGFSSFSKSDYTCSGSVCAVPKSSSNDCNDNIEFWWSTKSSCCVKGGSSTLTPPSYHSCPSGWSWGGSYCIPSTSTDASNNSPSCKVSGHNWFSDLFACASDTFESDTGSDCSTSKQFWWTKANGGGFCCTTGDSSSDQPPSGSSCPSTGWFWDSGRKCCIPKTTNDCSTPKPTCSTSGHVWDSSSRCCKGPTPSGRRKRALPSVVPAVLPLGSGPDAARCPRGLTACPIENAGGRNGTDYECLNPKTELESCGGCKSLGNGQDCTAITGAKSVGCEVGKCKIYSCGLGFVPSSTGNACVRSASFTTQHRRTSPGSLRARL